MKFASFKLAPMTHLIVLINVLVFVVLNYIPGLSDWTHMLGLRPSINPEYKHTQLITHMFVHANTIHLLFNMIALWSFGRWVEPFWGAWRLLVFYLICGIGSAMFHSWLTVWQIENLLASYNIVANVYPEGLNQLAQKASLADLQFVAKNFGEFLVGASGAVYGVLIAFALRFPDFKLIFLLIPFPVKAKWFVPAILMIDLVLFLKGSSIASFNIAHDAHLAGAAIGFILFFIFNQYFPQYSPQKVNHEREGI